MFIDMKSADAKFEIRSATPADVPVILQLIRDLATYERAPNALGARSYVARSRMSWRITGTSAGVADRISNFASADFMSINIAQRKDCCLIFYGNAPWHGKACSG